MLVIRGFSGVSKLHVSGSWQFPDRPNRACTPHVHVRHLYDMDALFYITFTRTITAAYTTIV
jgi:hypothetical protein